MADRNTARATGLSPAHHQAQFYSCREELVDAALPFLRDGVEERDLVFAVSGPGNVAAFRERLGPRASKVAFADAGRWFAQPLRTLRAVHALADTAESRGSGYLRLLGEQPWCGRTPAQVAASIRYEAVLDAVCADRGVRSLCPYDLSAAPAEAVNAARRAHPVLSGGSGPARSPDYLGPHGLLAVCDSRELPEPPPEAVVHGFAHPRDLLALRHRVREYGTAAGLAPSRVQEVVLAVHELAANILVHALSPGMIRMWAAPGDVVFDVVAPGPPPPPHPDGYLPPDLDGLGGRGLWLIQTLSGDVESGTTAAGATTRIHAGPDR
ncbi:sensor histidine kinase [Bailinhaonella thermotolerans]|uniref:Sensor histidine kinase n=1 Tax=Bailinhaonella thermotolerans TaxID=1070861 RepID=A0A3A4ADN8_9ACTN|nr:sensor histidine kinase [Bailinhaonella thermotolerans]RJL24784.1 sensor histidine kinase [Bailinhaonella thermotolerans]